MNRSKCVGLRLERLDDRDAPAAITFQAGVLSISHPTVVAGATSVTLTQVAPNSFIVFDDGGVGVVRDGVKAIRYTGGPARDTVTMRLNGLAFSGSASFATGAGDDTVTILGGGGSVGNGLTVNTGPGDDTVRLNSDAAAGGVFVLGPVRVTDPAGTDAVSLGNAGAPSQFMGNIGLGGVNTVRLAFGQPDVFRSISATVAGDPHPLDFQTTNTPAVVTVFGNLRLTGGPGDDEVVDSSMLVTGNVAINLGRAADAAGNDVSQWAAQPALQVNGNYTFTGGTGSDEVYLSGQQVGGNVILTLGGGPDTVDLSTLTSGTQPRVRGDLTIRGGNDVVNFEGVFLDGVTVAVGGDFSVALGNGANRMRVATAPGGVFRWTSGTGADALTFIPAAAGQNWDVRIRLGGGDDTFSLSGPGAGQEITGQVDFGGDMAGDVFTHAANWTLDPVGFRAVHLP